MGTYIIAGIGSMYAFVTGNTSVAFQVLLWVMVIDIASGLLKGIKNKNLKSIIMNMGMLKKAGLMLAITLAALLDKAVNGGQPVFSTMMTWATIGNESLSIVENLATVGVKIPKVITDKLGQIVIEAERIHEDKS